ncbi:MAG: hypothetical protein V1743_05675 [Nanoarchaeota archaeon]
MPEDTRTTRKQGHAACSGQIAFEFLMMLGMAMVIMVVFLAIINPIIQQKNEETADELFQDLGLAVQKEIITARVVRPGYIREFYIPPPELNSTYDRYTYSFSNNNSYLFITGNDQHYNYPIPNITGSLHIGLNTIRNADGEILVN